MGSVRLINIVIIINYCYYIYKYMETKSQNEAHKVCDNTGINNNYVQVSAAL